MKAEGSYSIENFETELLCYKSDPNQNCDNFVRSGSIILKISGLGLGPSPKFLEYQVRDRVQQNGRDDECREIGIAECQYTNKIFGVSRQKD
uniref:Uncharacterized protein n=1 Tax=Romanomermis culicivorax TaxID=13658 RepID=A0A915JYN2_ROMCU